MFKTIDGAVVSSEMDDDVHCEMTFQTESVLQRFMLRFEVLALDCSDHLYIFDGDIVSNKSKVSLSWAVAVCERERDAVAVWVCRSRWICRVAAHAPTRAPSSLKATS